MHTEDGYFIHRCLNGETESFGFLVDKYRESVFAFAYSKLRNFDDAEDVTQDVFLKAYRNLRTLRRWDNFAIWLHSITNNLCLDWLRTKVKHSEKRKLIANQDPSTSKDSPMDSRDDDPRIELLNKALEILPEIYRQVLTLYYLGEKNTEEIAKFLGISPTTVRQRLSRARSELKEEMIAMMSKTFEQKGLPVGFTFRVIEMVKRIKINPVAQLKGLPWGLSLATGLLVAVLSFNPHFISLDLFGTYKGSPLSAETKVLKVGEIPVDVVKTSNIAIISSQQGRKDGEAPSLQNSHFMAPNGEVGTWTNKSDMQTGRRYLTTSVVNGKIYAIGGANGITDLSTVEEYDPITDAWKRKSDMPTARKGHAASVVNGVIYVIGGYAGWSPNAVILSTVEAYNPLTDTWMKKTDIPTPRCFFDACAVNGKIYTFGGCNPNQFDPASVAFEVYDPVADKWEKKADMPVNRMEYSTSVVNGVIHIIGGWGIYGLSYDTATDKWVQRSIIPTGRSYLSTTIVNGEIYAIGGCLEDTITIFPTVEVYNSMNDTWTKKADMPTSRYGLSVSAVNGRIYAIGGTSTSVGANQNSLPTVEEYDTGFSSENVEAKGKLPTTWGQKK